MKQTARHAAVELSNMASCTPETRSQTRRRLLVCSLLLLAAVLITYVRCLSYGLVPIDDPGYVSENSHVMSGLTWSNARWAFTEFYRSNWHPLTWLSLQIDASIYGNRFGGFHLTNVVLHAVNSMLVLLVFERLTRNLLKSSAIAFLFALHPQHVESVAWVTERKDVLSLLFGLLALLAYTRYVRHRTGLWYGLVVICFFLSLLSKPMLVTLPCVLLLLDWWPLSRSGSERGGWLLLEKLPLFLLSVVSSVVTMLAQRSGLAIKPDALFPPSERCGNAILSVWWYVQQTFWPLDLTALYPHTRAAVTEPRVLFAAGMLFLITLGAVLLRKKCPALLVGWLWFVGGLIPVLGIVVQQGWQGMADRYVYWPHVGLLFAIVEGIAALALRLKVPATVTRIAVGLVCAVLSVLTFQQCGTWRDGVTLSQQSLAARSPNPLGHLTLGIEYAGQGDLNAARREFQTAVNQDPNLPPALNRLAGVLTDLGRPAEALPHYDRLQQILPRGIGWRLDHARTCVALGRLDQAVSIYRAVLAEHPSLATAQFGLGHALNLSGKYDEAQQELLRAIELMPDSPDAYYWQGRTALALQDEKASLEMFRQVLRRKPADVSTIDLASFTLLTQNHPQEAAAIVANGLEWQPNSAGLISTSALIQSQLGHREQAEKLYTQASAVDPRWPSQVYKQSFLWSTHSNERLRMPKHARWLARKLTEAFPKRPEGYDALAASLAASGEFDQALTEIAKAIDFAAKQPEVVTALRKRQENYRNRKLR